MDIRMPAFTQTQIANATGVPIGKMRVWVNRKHLRYVEQDEAHPGSMGHRLSAATALRFALMHELTEHFVPPSIAGEVVTAFMEGQSGGGGWSGDEREDVAPRRNPGELFDHGETVICVFKDGKSQVACWRPDGPFRPFLGGISGMTIVPIDEVYQTVLQRLDRMVRAAPPAPKRRPEKQKTVVDA